MAARRTQSFGESEWLWRERRTVRWPGREGALARKQVLQFGTGLGEGALGHQGIEARKQLGI